MYKTYLLRTECVLFPMAYYFQNVLNTYLSKGWILDVLFPFCHKVGAQDRNKTLFIQIHIPAHKYYLNQGCASIPCLSCRITKNFSWYHSIRFVLLF